jgi:hypothetical protein
MARSSARRGGEPVAMEDDDMSTVADVKHFVRVEDLDARELDDLFRQAVAFAAGEPGAGRAAGRVLGTAFFGAPRMFVGHRSKGSASGRRRSRPPSLRNIMAISALAE